MPNYQPGVTFSDIPAGHWAEADIRLLYEAGMASGYPDGTFKPDNPQSRIETVVFMARVLREMDLRIGEQAQDNVNAAVTQAVQYIRQNLRVGWPVRIDPATTPNNPAVPISTNAHNAPLLVTIG